MISAGPARQAAVDASQFGLVLSTVAGSALLAWLVLPGLAAVLLTGVSFCALRENTSTCRVRVNPVLDGLRTVCLKVPALSALGSRQARARNLCAGLKNDSVTERGVPRGV